MTRQHALIPLHPKLPTTVGSTTTYYTHVREFTSYQQYFRTARSPDFLSFPQLSAPNTPHPSSSIFAPRPPLVLPHCEDDLRGLQGLQPHLSASFQIRSPSRSRPGIALYILQKLHVWPSGADHICSAVKASTTCTSFFVSAMATGSSSVVTTGFFTS